MAIEPSVIENAVLKTIEVNPNFTPFLNQVFIYNSLYKVTPSNFTSKDGVRNSIRGMTSKDLVHFVCYELTKIYNAAVLYYTKLGFENFDNIFPNFKEIQRIMINITDLDEKNDTDNAFIYMLYNPDELSAAYCSVAYYFQNESLFKFINTNGMGRTSINNKLLDVFGMLKKDYENVPERILFNIRAIKKADSKLVNQKMKYYSTGNNLYITQAAEHMANDDINSVVLTEHPIRPDVKFLAISNGMIGGQYGQQASQYILTELKKWFENLNTEIMYYPTHFRNNLNIKITKLNDEVFEKFNSNGKLNAGSSLICAIDLGDNLIISSVGDSKCFMQSNRYLQYITVDENAIWEPDKDVLGVYNQPRCMGMKNLNLIESRLLNKSSFKKLVIMTKGLQDLVSEDKIEIISSSMPLRMISEKLVDEALNNKNFKTKPKVQNEEIAAAVFGGK